MDTLKTNRYLLLFWLGSLIYFEFALTLTTTKHFQWYTALLTMVFASAYGLFFLLITYFLKQRAQRIINFILILLVSILFLSQFIYYQIFQTFYTVYSLGHGGQVLEFYNEIIHALKTNIIYLPIYLIPLISFFIFKKYLINHNVISLKHALLIMLSIFMLHGGALGLIHLGSKQPNSPYQLYYKIHYPVFSIDNLGMLTSFRLDFQRLVTRWEPPLEPLPDIAPEPLPDDNPETPIEYNVLDIDFDKLIEEEQNTTLLAMHNYFKNVTPTAKNEYTGIYKDYNLIVITAEAFSHLAVHRHITPTLYKMVHQGYYFKNFYTPIWGVSTSDGEYVANIGLIPKSNVWSFRRSSENALPFTMAHQLKPLGYSAYAYHNHTYNYYGRDQSHPNMGYIYKGLGNGLNMRKPWPSSDLEMMKASLPDFIDAPPFHAYYMTVSGHLNYNFFGNSMAYKNRDLVADLPYSTAVKAYLAGQIELDKAMEYLLNQLEQRDLASNTLIVLSADHYPYGLKHSEIEELAGHPVDENFELYRNALIIYTKDMPPTTIEAPASSLDIIPTLSNLMGLPYDSRLLMGRDLFSDSSPLVIFNNRSFISDKGKYNAKTHLFDRNYGEKVDDDYISKMNRIINAKFQYSAQMLDMDYYAKVVR